MRIFQVGTQSVAIVAIGVQAQGIIAIGPLANGVIAIGQLATGVVAIGQLSLGLLSIGQLALSPIWAVGMLGVAPVSGGGLLMLTPLGSVPIGGLLKGRPTFARGQRGTNAIVWAVLIAALAGVAWWFAGAAPLIDVLTRVDGVFRSRPRVLG